MLRRTWAGCFFILTSLSMPALAQAGADTTINRVFNGTQLQGELLGMGLIAIPGYLLDPDIAFPYQKRSGFAEEIPFTDSFVINRVMGGYRPDWIDKFHLARGDLGRRSLDYVIKRPDGSLEFRPKLIAERLQPYLAAGYKPSDITLALDNVPWDLSTPDGYPPQEGPWGRNTPPGNMTEWSNVVRHFASDLKAYLGAKASDITFETGIEFDKKVSFDATAAQFFQYYKMTADAVHSILPDARMSPGEMTGTGSCASTVDACVYDTRDFLDFARRAHITPSYIPRSLYSLVDRPNPWPATAAEHFSESYRRLPPVVEEVHQFGLLFQPFGETEQGDPGPMSANWQFQTLFDLLEQDVPKRIFHWGGIATVGKLPFLDGTGFLCLVLDHYLGRHLLPLDSVDKTVMPYPATVKAVALQGQGSAALLISSYSPRPAAGDREVQVALPPALWGTHAQLRIVAYKATGNVFASIRRDLAANDNLKNDFANCALCLGYPIVMAKDPDLARKMIIHNWTHYETKMHDDLEWKYPQHDEVSVAGIIVTANLEANELLVIETQ